MIFKIEKKLKNSLGRAGIIKTSHGDINTPAFVPVGTKATIKSLTPEQVKNLGAEVILANTYHLYLQPGDEQVAKAGGLHEFMNWQMPIITDSGGFQVFSLGAAYGKDFSKIIRGTELTTQIPERSSALDGVPKLASIGNDGVSFRSHIDGSLHYITPEKSIQIQHNLGADIIFAFDEATSPYESYVYQEEALSRTHAWAKRSLEEHQRLKLINTHPPAPSQRDGEFGYHTTDKMTWIALQDRAIEMRKNPTEVENILWESLRKNFTGFHFRRQHIIGNFIVDFLCLEKSIVIELDGDIHDYKKEEDKERTKFLEEKGFRVVRFKNEEVLNDLSSVLESIDKYLALPFGEGWGGVDVSNDFFSPAIFGIVQGGLEPELRKKSAEYISSLDFDGFGIGGSYTKEHMEKTTKLVNEILPEDKPRHLLGIGEPEDLFMGVENGVDTFDCVAPTRIARNGTLYTKYGKINILNTKYRDDFSKLDKDCGCYFCQNYTVAYLAHLFHAKEMLAATLASIHNLYFIINLVKKIRQSILDESFYEFKEDFLKNYLN